MKPEIQLQREYYTQTAQVYESMHLHDEGHDLACAIMAALSTHHQCQSILDVGSGTGRAVVALGQTLPQVRIIGVEPVEALRKVGHANGIPCDQLIDGDATKLDFPDASFDLVCELAILHHLQNPRQAIAEMLRVAKKAIFISDSNRFGQGSMPSKYLKRLLWRLKLWPLANWIKTKGKGYNYEEGDGVAYSYSVFDDYDFIRSQCDQVMVFNLGGSGRNAQMGAPNIGLFGLKRQTPPEK